MRLDIFDRHVVIAIVLPRTLIAWRLQLCISVISDESFEDHMAIRASHSILRENDRRQTWDAYDGERVLVP